MVTTAFCGSSFFGLPGRTLSSSDFCGALLRPHVFRRVTNNNRGIKEDDALRLVQAFVVSRITYSAPYLQLTKADRETLNTTIRKAVKLAVGLPVHSSTQKLLGMGK